MKGQEPKTFEEILELQKIHDSNMNHTRERNLIDIKLSMIAEIIEFNEETKDSHKTWKTKEYNSEKELEELTDIFFFFAQWINNSYDSKCVHILEKIFHFNDTGYADIYLLISNVTRDPIEQVLVTLMKIVHKYGYTKDDILKTYWKKWQYNMSERLGKEWN
ncbi:MAG: dUTP diphosphatase [Fusobacterium necrophorum]|nr:dUTP diphosphatase [Fusobacterium necrophorum]MCI7342680.1 dUTP diphosphatase [Fusobacterium necrophorum]